MSFQFNPKLLDSKGRADFQVRIHLIECRELKAKASNGICDPVVYVTVDNKKETTQVFKNTLSCVFDHLMFFEFKWKPQDAKLKNISIQVYDSNTIRRNVLIGQFPMDIFTVYSEKGHEIWRKWTVLTNPNEPGIKGFLKFSSIVLGPREESPIHNEEDEDDEDKQEEEDLKSMILTPPSIDTVRYKLKIYCYKAEDLPKMDTFGSADPFVEVSFAANPIIRTEVKKKTLNPIWNQEIVLAVSKPTLAEMISLNVFDWERNSKSNDLIATTFFKFSQLENGPIGPKWINLYGPPKNSLRTKFKKKVVENSEYKGRILLGLESVVDPNAKPDKNTIPVFSKVIPSENYTVRFDLFEGAEFPANLLEKCFVELSIGPLKLRSKIVSPKKNIATWYESFKDLTFEYPKDHSQIPDIFINVYLKNRVLGKARLGYLRIPFSEALGISQKPKWQMLEPDHNSAVGKLDNVPGFLLYKMDAGVAKDISVVPRSKLVRPPMKKYQVRAHIYQGKDLPPADDTGFSDPYCIVKLGGSSVKTTRKEETLYPTWYETVTFETELPEPLNLAPDIVVMCYDWDKISSDDFLGRFYVKTNEIGKKFPGIPKWYKLWVNDPELCFGEILASFQLIPISQVSSFPLPESIIPEFKSSLLQISAIGLRDLLPHKMSRIKKPFIEFDCSQGTVKTKKERSKYIVKTSAQSLPTGTNPNFLEVFRMPVEIPLNHIFASSVMLRIFDQKGLGSSLIATGAVSLEALIPWANIPFKNPNLPPIVDKIPGATKEGEPIDEEVEEVDEEKDREERNRILMCDALPNSIEEANQVFHKLITFENEETSDIETEILGVRTLPDVEEKELDIEEKNDDNEDEDEAKEKEVVEYKDPRMGRGKILYELEHDLRDIPFFDFDLTRGRVRGISSFEKKFRSKSQNPNTKRVVGKFKGNFKIFDTTDKSRILPPPKLAEMFQPQKYIVRAYILRGMNLVPKDTNGSSDPYIVMSTGKTKEFIKSDRENYQKKTLRPDFYKCYEIPAIVPGNSSLEIAVYDYDTITSDELIGKTVIDLESRLFSSEWKQMQPKPIEYRALWNSSSTNPQGKIEMWLDIMTEKEALENPPLPLFPPQKENFEIRAVAWNIKDVVFKDKKMSDIFITCQFNNGERQKSDIHWRSTDGKGSFNWRFVFPVQIPSKFSRLKFQLWDKDILNANDSIAESVLDLQSFCKRAYRQKTEQNIKKQWIDMLHPNFTGKQGSLELSISLLTEAEAIAKPVGKGRKDPNQYPFLSKPDRPLSSIAPWRLDKMMKFGWKKHKWKVYCCCLSCCACLILILVLYFKVF